MSVPPFRYTIALCFDEEIQHNAYNLINSAIYTAFGVNEALKDNFDMYIGDNFSIELDDEIGSIFIHKSYCSKLDWQKIFSIVTPITNALNIEPGDYEVYDYKKDKNIDLPKNIYEYADYTNASEKKALAKGPTNQIPIANRFCYMITIPLCDYMAYQRIANAIDVPDAFPRRRRDECDCPKSNNYGEYKTDKFSISLDGDMAFIYFASLDLEFMASVMNPICDALLIKRGNYTIIDDHTDQEIDPSSVTLKSVLDLEDGEMTPFAKQNKHHIHYDDDGNEIISDSDEDDSVSQEEDDSALQEEDDDSEYMTFDEHLQRIQAEYPHYTEEEAYERAVKENNLGYNYIDQIDINHIDELLKNNNITFDEYITKKIPDVPDYINYTDCQRKFLQTVYRFTKAYDINDFTKSLKYEFIYTLYKYIQYNINVFQFEFNKKNTRYTNKLFVTMINKANELIATANNELDEEFTVVDPIILNSFVDTLTNAKNLIQQTIDDINN